MGADWHVLGVRLLPHELDDLHELARMRGVSLSDVVRHAIGLAPEKRAVEGRLAATSPARPAVSEQ